METKSSRPKQWLDRYFHSIQTSDFGSMAVVIGLVIIGVIFQIANKNFLTPLNLTNLMAQIAVIGILSVGIILVLLIGEIDLSVGSVSGAAAAVMAVLITNYRISSVAAILVAILVGFLIGAMQGFFVGKIHVPSFIVTLAGLMIWQGAQLFILGNQGTINMRDPFIRSIANALIPPWLGWVIGILAVIVVAFTVLQERKNREQAGLSNPVPSMAISRLVVIAIAILGAVALMNFDRNQVPNGKPIQGVPSSVFIFICFIVVFDLITRFTKFGRHIYTVGGNAEAARRASIEVDRVRIWVFALCSAVAACGGIVAASRLIAVNYGSGGGSLLLSAIAAAVIGGTSLFGGRGSTWAALLGALVIGSINNGMDLLAFPSSIKLMITGVVLMLAVILDSVSRERRKRAGRG
jgi:D-xylose transport system permease protein